MHVDTWGSSEARNAPRLERRHFFRRQSKKKYSSLQGSNGRQVGAFCELMRAVLPVTNAGVIRVLERI